MKKMSKTDVTSYEVTITSTDYIQTDAGHWVEYHQPGSPYGFRVLKDEFKELYVTTMTVDEALDEIDEAVGYKPLSEVTIEDLGGVEEDGKITFTFNLGEDK